MCRTEVHSSSQVCSALYAYTGYSKTTPKQFVLHPAGNYAPRSMTPSIRGPAVWNSFTRYDQDIPKLEKGEFSDVPYYVKALLAGRSHKDSRWVIFSTVSFLVCRWHGLPLHARNGNLGRTKASQFISTELLEAIENDSPLWVAKSLQVVQRR
jgi:hypothetical protein